jgi:hypothetical protein
VKARYIAIYKIHGANKLPDDSERASLLALQSPALTATLTTNPEPDLLHVDKSAALGAQVLKGVFAPDKEGTLEERLAAEIEHARARRAKQTGKAVFLVFDGETEIPTPGFKARRDTDEFAVCLDAISKAEIRVSFRPSVQGVMTALSLSLPANADRRIEKISDVVYLIDPDNGKPIYAFTFQGGSARASIASPLTQTVIVETAALAPKLSAQKGIPRPASLLLTSLEKATDELQGFIAAWSALEIFANATFKSTYEARWFAIMEDGAPASAKPVFERFQDVMSDKYRLADKFLVIASVLDPDAATNDAKEFRRLKKFRDELLHAVDTPSSALPTDAVQKLVLKYMKLHLLAQG